jgi:hypothetical protein
LRFTLPILTFFMIMIAYVTTISEFRINTKLLSYFLIPYFLIMVLIMTVALYVRAQSSF